MPSTQKTLVELMNVISSTKTNLITATVRRQDLAGKHCVALYSADGLYYRGYIVKPVDQFAQVGFRII